MLVKLLMNDRRNPCGFDTAQDQELWRQECKLKQCLVWKALWPSMIKHDKDINISFSPYTLVGRVQTKFMFVLPQNTGTLLHLGRGTSEVPWWQYCELR
jgi:hypothetical protein